MIIEEKISSEIVFESLRECFKVENDETLQINLVLKTTRHRLPETFLTRVSQTLTRVRHSRIQKFSFTYTGKPISITLTRIIQASKRNNQSFSYSSNKSGYSNNAGS